MEAPAVSRRGSLLVRRVNNTDHIQLNHHSTGSAVLLPLRPQQSEYPGDIRLCRTSHEEDCNHVNLRELRISDQSQLDHPARQENFDDEDLKILHGKTCRALATTNRCALLQSNHGETQEKRYTLRLGTVKGGVLAVPVREQQFFPGGDLDLGAIVFHLQNTVNVVRVYPDTQDVSKRLDDWKFHHILDPLMKAAVPFEEIQYRDPDDNDRKRLW